MTFEFGLPIIADPWLYAVAAPAVLLVGISKGGLGGGLALLGVPLMSFVIPPFQAAAILLPILCLMDLVGVHGYRGRWDAGLVRRLVPAAVVGVGLGWALFGWIDARVVELAVGAVAIGFLIFQAAKDRLVAALPPPGPISGAVCGAAAGLTSFVAHAGGPPLAIHLLPMRLDKHVFVATSAVFFAIVNYVKLVPYAALGQLDLRNLGTSLVLAPLAPVGVRLGMWLLTRIPTALFYRVTYAALALAAVKLLHDGLTGPGGLLAG